MQTFPDDGQPIDEFDLRMPAWSPDWRQAPRVSCLVRRITPEVYENDLREKPILDIDYAPYHADRLSREFSTSSTTIDGHTTSSESRETGCSALPFAFEDSVLIASGFIVDTIRHTSVWPYSWYPSSVCPKEWLEMAETHYRKPDGSQPDANILHADLYSTMIGEPAGSFTATPSDDGSTDYTLWPCCDDLKENPLDVQTRRAALVKGRRFIVTEKGCIGLAPWLAESGFKLAILLGCSVPVVLQELLPEEVRGDEEPGLYFRGDCFAQEWMEGQTMAQFGQTDREGWEIIRAKEKLKIH